jgi:Type IV secretion system pilin
MTPQQKVVAEANSFVKTFNDAILFPIIALLSAVAFFVFLLGCAEYVFNASNPAGREKGIQHITWGIVGLVVMVSAWAILQIAAGTFGLDKQLNCANDPSASGCDTVFSTS